MRKLTRETRGRSQQMISKGRDMEAFFAQVVKNVAAPSIEIRKLVSEGVDL